VKLYKQEIVNGDVTDAKLELISENKSKEELMRKAENIAKEDGLLDFAWVDGNNLDELSEIHVNDKYRLIIRSW
jgi:hypothetical protein